MWGKNNIMVHIMQLYFINLDIQNCFIFLNKKFHLPYILVFQYKIYKVYQLLLLRCIISIITLQSLTHGWQTGSDNFLINFVNLCHILSKKLPFELFYHGSVLQIIITLIKIVL